MKIIKKMLCVVVVLAMVLSGCGQKREAKINAESEQPKSLCVFYTPNNEVLINNFEKLYPEYELEKVIMAGDIADEISRGRIPDLIIAQGSTPLLEWKEKGYIQDFSSWYGQDETIREENYFPGALDIGRDEGMLLAMPLTAQVTYMTVRESVVEETLYGHLPKEYTLEDYLNVLQEEYSEVIDKGMMVVSGTPFYSDFIGLLFATGAISYNENQIEIDQTIFEILYDICIENCRNFQEDAFISTGVYRNAALDPRDGEYKAAYWYGYPPQVGLLYAQSVNQAVLDENIDVFWWPMKGDAGRYAAEITTLGMVGAESENVQTAYDVLRLMMDTPQKEWIQPKMIGNTSMRMYMPIHIDNSKELCSYVETNGMTEFSVNSTGNEYVFVEKQVWDEELIEKVFNMIDGIQYVYRLDSNKIRDVKMVADKYITSLNVNAATACYEDVLQIFQQGG